MRFAAWLLWALLAPAAAAAASEVWLELESPEPEAAVSTAVALAPVRGLAGVGARRDHDVVIALDVSSSTWLASEVDVDGDGRVGRVSSRLRRLQRGNVQTTRLEATHYSSDPDDSVAAALAEGARRLIERIDLGRSRVALVDFAESARVASPLGATRHELLAALGELRRDPRGGGTDLEAAIRTASALLEPAADAPERARTLVLLSDGQPSLPAPPSQARARALAAADDARGAGIRILACALGPERDGLALYERIARTTGGAMTHVGAPGEILVELPRTNLTALESIAIENRSRAAPARAVRLRADGSFDALVPLAPGWNELRVTARSASGGEASLERRVRYAPREPTDAAEARRQALELEALLEALRARTAETELLNEIEAARRERSRRALELDAESEGSAETRAQKFGIEPQRIR